MKVTTPGRTPVVSSTPLVSGSSIPVTMQVRSALAESRSPVRSTKSSSLRVRTVSTCLPGAQRPEAQPRGRVRERSRKNPGEHVPCVSDLVAAT